MSFAQSSWFPVDLSEGFPEPEPPSILTRADGVSLFYRGRTHWLQGESESHKSWVALVAVEQQLKAGHNVAFVDFEDHPAAILERLRALGVPDATIADQSRFMYIRPNEPVGDLWKGGLADALIELHPSLAVIDGVSESMMLEGMDPLSTPDTAQWVKRLPKAIAALPSTPAVPVIDHQTKSSEGRKGWAFGSQHKRAAVDGAAYDVTAVRKLSRALRGEPEEGLVSVTVAKDRPGYVRGHSPGDNAGTFELTAYPDGGVTYQITTNALARDFGLRKHIANYLSNAPGAGAGDIRRLGGKGTGLDDAIRGMLADGEARMEQQGQKHAHYLTEAGFEKYIGGDE